jgi:hypothetical protein
MANTNFVDGTYNLGTDISITVLDNDTNAPISLAGRLVSFKADPKIAEVISTPIDNSGYVQHRTVPQGWTGTITIDRAQGDLDSLQALMESNFYATGAQKYFTIGQSTRNQNNKQVDSYNFLFCTMNMETSGEYKAADKVVVTLKFSAQQRIPG